MDDHDYKQPNTRARIAARRKRSNIPRGESGVIPGPRRTVGGWLSSGRILSLPLLVISLLVLVYVTASPNFRVRNIRVEGADLAEPAAIVALSQAEGQSIWIIDVEQVVARVATNAYVEHANAFLSLPNQLTIMVQERQPEVRWQSAGQQFLVDANGRVLGLATTPLSNTLIIDDRSGRAIQPNDLIDRSILVFGRELSLRLSNELGVPDARLAWTGNGGMIVELDQGRIVFFGQGDHLDRKLAVLKMLLNDQTPFRQLDLRPETPYYRNDP